MTKKRPPYSGEPKPVFESYPSPVTINVGTFKKIQSLIDAHLVYSGQETGKQYDWYVAGAIVDVDERDVPALLSKRLGGTTCCGANQDGNKIFELIGD